MTGRRAVLVVAAVTVVLTPAALAAARWPRWWSWIAPEQTPMTWLQSVVLVLASAGCLLLGYVCRRLRMPVVPWFLLAGGFLALALDERFAVHERIRDGVLAPRGVTVPFLPWVAPGDFLLLGLAVAGLAVLPLLWRAFAPDRGATRCLVGGVVLAVLAVAGDSIDPSTWSTAAERVQQTAEEVVELGAGLLLLCAVALRLLGLLETALATPNPASGAPGTDTASSWVAGGHRE